VLATALHGCLRLLFPSMKTVIGCGSIAWVPLGYRGLCSGSKSLSWMILLVRDGMGCRAKFQVMGRRFIRLWSWCGTDVRWPWLQGSNQGQGRTLNVLLVEHETNGLVQGKVNLCSTETIEGYCKRRWPFKCHWGSRPVMKQDAWLRVKSLIKEGSETQ